MLGIVSGTALRAAAGIASGTALKIAANIAVVLTLAQIAVGIAAEWIAARSLYYDLPGEESRFETQLQIVDPVKSILFQQ